MITSMLIYTSAFVLLAFIVFVRAFTRTVHGYEDAYGFHEGSDPQRDIAFANLVLSTTAEPSRQPYVGYRTKRVLKQASFDPMQHSAATSYPF
jgi:hypothetical protein